jgi:GTP-binding protein EngB required for normal cell division
MALVEDSDSLNEHQAHYLLVTCQHIDKILSDIENILNESISQATFPSYCSDLIPAQHKTIRDYITHIRTQLLQILEGQNIEYKNPCIPVSRVIHNRLSSIDIAAEELKPKYMRGYGNLSDSTATELNGIVGELQGLVKRLDRYILGGVKQDFRERLRRLEGAGNDLDLLSLIEQVVSKRGLVQFMGTISLILDRAEDRNFEIAVFGRVSSGKSSLLNAVLDFDVLPVGVTPVTAIPVRIAYGEDPSLIVSFTDASAKEFDIRRISEFATEQENPKNVKHVARISLKVSLPRLGDGVSFVDTPGLGSLATNGAAETLAYLPKCDLGVVLINAGSTLAEADLQTISTLQEAAIPAHILLSKVDLLDRQDCEKTIEYVKQHIISETGQDLPVYPVSIRASHRHLLNRWFERDIFPLYSRSQELRSLSLQRKIGALRESVVIFLQNQIHQNSHSARVNQEEARLIESRLRKAAGLIEDTRSACNREIHKIVGNGPDIFFTAAVSVIEEQSKNEYNRLEQNEIAFAAVLRVVQESSKNIQILIETLALRLQDELMKSAEELEISETPGKDEFVSIISNMPVFDPGKISLNTRKSVYAIIMGKRFAEKELAQQMRQQLGPFFEKHLSAYMKLMQEWTGKVIGEVGRRFEIYADIYRAQTGQSFWKQELTPDEIRSIEDDLILLGGL